MQSLKSPWLITCVASTSRRSIVSTSRANLTNARTHCENNRVHGTIRKQAQAPLLPSGTRLRRISSRPISQYRRLFSSTQLYESQESEAKAPPPKGQGNEPEGLTPEQHLAWKRLYPIIEELPEPIDWAIAYGSGVIHQANASPTSPPPLTDFILSTPSPELFHTRNLAKHPHHYPLYARAIGGAGIAWLQESFGAGIWYITMVKLKGIDVKYGIISTARLKQDLEEWNTLYVAGRLHKPVLPLILPSTLLPSINQNLKSALHLSLLLLPPTFTELELWETIAGISYSGDPRMSVPGAENPQKVKNIVRGKGNLEGFRDLYGPIIKAEKGLGWVDREEKSEGEGEGKWEWRGRGEEILTQSYEAMYRSNLMLSLPTKLQQAVALRLGLKDTSDSYHLLGFWAAKSQSDQFKKILQEEVGNIIRRPALTQSFKGLVTAGPVKSFWYSLEKVKKWWKARSSS